MRYSVRIESKVQDDNISGKVKTLSDMVHDAVNMASDVCWNLEDDDSGMYSIARFVLDRLDDLEQTVSDLGDVSNGSSGWFNTGGSFNEDM